MTKATADDVRRFVAKHYISPARAVGQSPVTIRCGTVHSHMGLVDRMPLVCSSIQTREFADRQRVALTSRVGPDPGANLWLTFDVLP